jgi:hypothetical protein
MKNRFWQTVPDVFPPRRPLPGQRGEVVPGQRGVAWHDPGRGAAILSGTGIFPVNLIEAVIDNAEPACTLKGWCGGRCLGKAKR